MEEFSTEYILTTELISANSKDKNNDLSMEDFLLEDFSWQNTQNHDDLADTVNMESSEPQKQVTNLNDITVNTTKNTYNYEEKIFNTQFQSYLRENTTDIEFRAACVFAILLEHHLIHHNIPLKRQQISRKITQFKIILTSESNVPYSLQSLIGAELVNHIPRKGYQLKQDFINQLVDCLENQGINYNPVPEWFKYIQHCAKALIYIVFRYYPESYLKKEILKHPIFASFLVNLNTQTAGTVIYIGDFQINSPTTLSSFFAQKSLPKKVFRLERQVNSINEQSKNQTSLRSQDDNLYRAELIFIIILQNHFLTKNLWVSFKTILEKLKILNVTDINESILKECFLVPLQEAGIIEEILSSDLYLSPSYNDKLNKLFAINELDLNFKPWWFDYRVAWFNSVQRLQTFYSQPTSTFWSKETVMLSGEEAPLTYELK